MYESYSPYLKSELAYRRERLLDGTRKTRRTKLPRERKTTSPTTTR